MEKFQRRFTPAFSPMITVLGTCVFAGLGLSILSFVGPHPSKYVWLGVLGFLFVGVALQFFSNRVLIIRVYGALGWGLAALVFAILAWSVTVLAWGQKGQVLAAAVIGAMLLGYGALVFVGKYYSPQRERMPYGVVGKMNQKTGVIVDPRYMEGSSEAQAKSAQGTRTVARLSPLIAGFTMLLARSLSANVEVLLFIPLGLFLAAVATLVAASQASYAVSIARWEREHGKRIYVKK